jgi:hypothetical protein
MCLLTFFPPDVMPDTTALANGAALNSDGHGYALIADGQLIVGKSMQAQPLIDDFDRLRHLHPHGPALFHSRMATHGEHSTDNCHPFALGGDHRTVLAHNGVLPKDAQPTKGDPRSDTRIAAETFIPTIGHLRLRRVRHTVEQWMTPHNKIVILTVDRRYKQQAYILNEDAGLWVGDIWYSNNGYLPYDANIVDDWWDWPSKSLRRAPIAAGFERCGYCLAIIDPTFGECRVCGWCLDCGEMPEHCYCYTPAFLDPKTTTPRTPARR